MRCYRLIVRYAVEYTISRMRALPPKLAGKSFFSLVFEFRSFRPIRTIAGPGGVMDPSQSQNTGGRTTTKSSQKARITGKKV